MNRVWDCASSETKDEFGEDYLQGYKWTLDDFYYLREATEVTIDIYGFCV